MQNFFIFTRGRTGSTAIVDELGKHPEITTMQELFIKLEKAPRLLEAYQKYGKDFYKHIESQFAVLPFDAWLKRYSKINLYGFGSLYIGQGGCYTRAGLTNRYLAMAEKVVNKEGKKFGFKVLANHFDEWPDLRGVLKNRSYLAVYLERENVFRQVISGVVAKHRGVYNRKNYTPTEESFCVDLDEFEMLVRCEQAAVASEKEQLKQWGFDVHIVTYEDFVNERDLFFKHICECLGVSYTLPERTDYSVMISDLSKTVENYEDLVNKVKSMGLGDML